MLHVNIYEVNQCYGGPEEGGWYYTAGDFIRCIGTFPDNKEGRQAAEALRKTYLALQQSLDLFMPGGEEDVCPFADNSPDYKMGYGPHDGVDADGEPDDRYLIPGGAWGYSEIKALIQAHKGMNYPETRPYYC